MFKTVNESLAMKSVSVYPYPGWHRNAIEVIAYRTNQLISTPHGLRYIRINFMVVESKGKAT